MKDLCSGQISEGSKREFISSASLDDHGQLVVTLEGIIRVDDSTQLLSGYIRELARSLASLQVPAALVDFTRLRFCNSTGFYAVMDILDAVYKQVSGPVTLRRLAEDEWHTETLPLLLIALGDGTGARTSFEDVAAP